MGDWLGPGERQVLVGDRPWGFGDGEGDALEMGRSQPGVAVVAVMIEGKRGRRDIRFGLGLMMGLRLG